MVAILAYLLAAGVRLDATPDSSWGGAGWESRAHAPSWYQQNALAALIRTVTQVSVGAMVVAGLAMLLHTVSRLLAQWKALSIRRALGARLAHLAALTLPDLLVLIGTGAVAGLAVGIAGWSIMRGALPGLLDLSVVPSHLLSWPSSLGFALPVLVVLLSLVLLLFVSENPARPPRLRIQSMLAALQLAGLLVVTYGGALILRSSPLVEPRGVNLDTSDAAIMSLTFTGDDARSPRERASAYRQLVSVLEGTPAAVSSPDAWLGFGKSVEVHSICDVCFIGLDFVPMSYARVRAVSVLPGALGAMGLDLARGRMLASRDDYDAPRVAVISDQTARELFPQAGPVGQIIRTSLDSLGDYRVVGVVRSLAPRGLGVTGRALPSLYLSALQHPPVLAEIAVAPEATAEQRALVRSIATSPAERLSVRAQRHQAPLTWFASILAGVSLLALSLALHAFAAVMSQLVEIRRREIAVRIALGARRRHVMRWVSARGLAITGGGVLVGFAVARLAGDLLHEHLSRSAEGDILLLFGLAMVFGVLGLVASAVPAVRAAGIEPNVALAEPRA